MDIHSAGCVAHSRALAKLLFLGGDKSEDRVLRVKFLLSWFCSAVRVLRGEAWRLTQQPFDFLARNQHHSLQSLDLYKRGRCVWRGGVEGFLEEVAWMMSQMFHCN